MQFNIVKLSSDATEIFRLNGTETFFFLKKNKMSEDIRHVGRADVGKNQHREEKRCGFNSSSPRNYLRHHEIKHAFPDEA